MIVPGRAALLAERHADGWSGSAEYPPGPTGLEYRCADCGNVFSGPSGARKHEQVNRGHIVLRHDWLADGYLQYARQRWLEAGRPA